MDCCGITENLRDLSRFTANEVGLHGDGAFGQMHLDAIVVRRAHQFGFELDDHGHLALIDADMNNGYAIETWDDIEWWHEVVREALDYLNEHAVEDDVFFEFFEGDLYLSPVEGD